MCNSYVNILIMCVIILDPGRGISGSVPVDSATLTTKCSDVECMYDALPAIEGDGQSGYDPVKTCYKNGEPVHITCSGGLNGRSDNMCVSGVWSYSFGSRCEASCGRPIVPNSDAISTHPNVQNGGHLTVTCNDGYTISGTGRTVLFCENGILYPDVPTCYADCEAPKHPDNGVVSLGENPYAHGQMAFFKCNDGFTLVGYQGIHCYDGLWDGNPPMCLASCNRPVVPNSDAISTEPSVQHGGALTVTCNAHYADGDRSRTVLFCDDGTLYPDVPSCEKEQMSSEDIAGVVLGVIGTVLAIVAIVVEIVKEQCRDEKEPWNQPRAFTF